MDMLPIRWMALSPQKRYSCRDDMAEICDDYNCIYDQWQIHEKELKGC